jgi:hypothetical protein
MNLRFKFERVISDRLFSWRTTTTCVHCGNAFEVRRGEILPVFRAGAEVIGVMCTGCLAPESLRRLVEMRSVSDEQGGAAETTR